MLVYLEVDMVAIIKYKANIFLLLLFFFSRLSFGQVGNWNFEHFSYKDGLASNEIFNMIQDEEGYVQKFQRFMIPQYVVCQLTFPGIHLLQFNIA